MPIINFSIPPTLQQQIEELMRKKGFSSKAEFFRYLVHMYIDTNDQSEEKRTASLIKKMNQAIDTMDTSTIPSLEEQLDSI